jgi:hypothetical protein
VLEVLLASTIVVDQPAPSATCGMICVSANAGSSPRMRKDTVKLGRDRLVIGIEILAYSLYQNAESHLSTLARSILDGRISRPSGVQLFHLVSVTLTSCGS